MWVLHDTLKAGASSMQEPYNAPEVWDLAARIEDAVWVQTVQYYARNEEHWPLKMRDQLWHKVLKFYTSRMRKLALNLGDTRRNPVLCQAVLTGKLKPERFVTMSDHEMFPELRAPYFWRQSLEAPDSEDEQEQADIHGLFKCGKCRSDRTTYYQLQTRGADESMTTYITCLDCGNHWKV